MKSTQPLVMVMVIFFDIHAGTEHAYIAMFDADVGDGSGSDNLNLSVYIPAPDYPKVSTNGNAASDEPVFLVNLYWIVCRRDAPIQA
ncbi:hypothetical protein QT397_03305 [Microbulbifer sp. MKSA007]|nr:hypothetical protein QT397_03305 [Microbulbifer sp. MKSA007]